MDVAKSCGRTSRCREVDFSATPLKRFTLLWTLKTIYHLWLAGTMYRFTPLSLPQGEAESGDMVEREAKRLEVLKRRQEREMGQLVQSQLMRKTLQV